VEKAVENVEKSRFSTVILRIWEKYPPEKALHISVHNCEQGQNTANYVAVGMEKNARKIWMKSCLFPEKLRFAATVFFRKK
jgi:hypothetical protein